MAAGDPFDFDKGADARQIHIKLGARHIKAVQALPAFSHRFKTYTYYAFKIPDRRLILAGTHWDTGNSWTFTAVKFIEGPEGINARR
jgi:hypothetical protein